MQFMKKKPETPEYFATTNKKIIILSLLTLGWYNLRWYITNFHRYVIAKANVQSPVSRASLALILYFCSFITVLLLAYDIKRQATAKKIKTWWHPLTLYGVFITAGIAGIPNSIPSLTEGFQLSALTYLSFYILSIVLMIFVLTTLQSTVNLINEKHSQLKHPAANRFGMIHILAFILAPFLWIFVVTTCYYHSLSADNLGYLSIKGGNYQQALKILEPASDRGNAKADLLLGQMYSQGLGVKKDKAIANSYYEKAAASQDPKILTVVGEHYLNNSEYVIKGINMLKQAAKDNFMPAINELSLIYSSNKYVPANYQKAFDYAKQSAEAGNATGEFLLSMLYYKNPEQKPVWREYIKYLKKSANQGYPPAAYYLGLGYRDGNQELPQDQRQAVKWFQQAAKHNYPPAMTALANAYSTGIGIEKNPQKAVKLYQAAAHQGDDIAQYNLGLAYMTGQGINQDDKKALNWYNQAAQSNNSCAINDLGIMYSEGRGVAADDTSAANYFKQAAVEGFSGTSDKFKPLNKLDDLVTLERSIGIGTHHISPKQYQQAYVTYMLSLHSKNKTDYQAQLQQLSPLALREAKYLQQYFKLACWQ